MLLNVTDQWFLAIYVCDSWEFAIGCDRLRSLGKIHSLVTSLYHCKDYYINNDYHDSNNNQIMKTSEPQKNNSI